MARLIPPPLFRDPEVVSYRSTAPVDGQVAARLAESILRPPELRDWAPVLSRCRTRASKLPRFLFGEVWIDPQACAAYHDVLWLVCQLARFARDEHIEFEIQLGAMTGRVSTGGLDSGGQQILSCAQARTSPWAAKVRDRRHRRASYGRTG